MFPAAATPAAATVAVEPPDLQPSLFLKEVPGFLLEQPQPPLRLSASELLIRQAEENRQAGRRHYRAGEIEQARADFNRAIDLMLEASEVATDRLAYQKRFDQMVESIHRTDLAGLGAADNLEEPGFEKSPLEEIIELTFPIDPQLKNKVQAELLATVSQLPLSINDAVLSYINYFSGRGHKTIMAGLERAGRYRPLIQRILDEEGLPQELIHLAQAESGFLPRALSRKRAAGMWQFLAWRGREYGLKQTAYTDERLDPEKATRAAARHLRDLYTQFGDWYLAIAAYNCGPGSVESAVERTGYADFWELRRRQVLPRETTNYVPIILALTIMTKNAQEYGLDQVKPVPPLEYDTVEVTAPTHLALVSDLTGAPLYELRDLNPSLLRNVAPAGYSLRVPRGAATTLVATLQTIPAERRASWRMHKVEHGETLASIGRQYGAKPGSIAAANQLESATPVVGDLLVIPAASKASPAPTRQRGTSKGKRVTVKARSRAATTSRSAAPSAARRSATLGTRASARH
jgi:membrane-bound lytic murein transglycosylase D